MGLLTTDLATEIREGTGIELDVRTSRGLGGGDIAHTCVCEDGQHMKYVLKLTSSSPGIGHSEASGLAALEAAAPAGLHVPHVYGCGRFKGSEWVLIAYMDTGSAREGSYFDFGGHLARLHARADETRYGFERDTYLGYTLQDNGWNGSWIEFFSQQRLKPLFEYAVDRHLLDGPSGDHILRLIEHPGDYIGEPEHPSLLHGDLWGGNHMFTPDGEPVLIDPAVYYGDREADIAMTQLFGSFPRDFYRGYEREYPLQDGYEKRSRVYRLYHGLNHLCMFGRSYLSLVRSLCQ
jgi:fructosamine-3-kinase